MKTPYFKYNYSMSFVNNLHEFLKYNNYFNGVHYIEIDCGDYICFCPFHFKILANFRGCFSHCITISETAFNNYFKVEFYERKNLKAFFIRKNAFPSDFCKEDLAEFTCWIYVESKPDKNKPFYREGYNNNYFYFLHDSHNHTFFDLSSHKKKNDLFFVEEQISKYYNEIIKTFKNSKKYKELIKKA